LRLFTMEPSQSMELWKCANSREPNKSRS
jgi:hypothetical protein